MREVSSRAKAMTRSFKRTPSSGLTERASAAATCRPPHNPTFLRGEASASCLRLLGDTAGQSQPQATTNANGSMRPAAPSATAATSPPVNVSNGLGPKAVSPRMPSPRTRLANPIRAQARANVGLTTPRSGNPSAALMATSSRKPNSNNISKSDLSVCPQPNGPHFSCGDFQVSAQSDVERDSAPTRRERRCHRYVLVGDKSKVTAEVAQAEFGAIRSEMRQTAATLSHPAGGRWNDSGSAAGALKGEG